MLTAAEPSVTAVAFAPDGKTVVACSQTGLRVYSWPALELQKSIEAKSANLHDLTFSPEGDRFAVGGGMPAESGLVEIFSWPAGESLQVLAGHKDSVMAVAWQDQSTLASASLDHEVILWDARKSSSVKKFKGHSRGVSTLCFLPKKQNLVTAGIDQTLRVWDIDTDKLVHSLSIHTQPVHDLALRPDESGLPMIASASEDGTVRLWQPTIGRMVRFVRLKSAPLAIDFSSDGSEIIAACKDGHVRLIDPDTVQVTMDIPAVDGWAYSIAVHPTDGSLVVGGEDGKVRRVDPRQNSH